MALAGSKFLLSKMPPPESVFTVYTYVTGFLMLIQTMLNQFVPRWVRQYIVNAIQQYFRPREKGNDATIVIEERVDAMAANEVYGAAETYLCTKVRLDIKRLKLVKQHRDTDFSIRFAQCEIIPDFFQGIKLEWRFLHQESAKTTHDHKTDLSFRKYFELSFDKKYKSMVLDSYMPFVLERVKLIRSEKKLIKLHTLNSAAPFATSVAWDSINLEHPSTFETLAMEPGLKESIIEDLDRFLRRKDFYRKVGRAWKRGYLLYGPPGTGKSSLIAAMANYLKFDIYDLELANVWCDSYLRKLLLRTANRSILVIEDIDCTVKLPDRNGPKASRSDRNANSTRPNDQKFTLSGLLNFIDGLWSSCGDERIIIFTTNNKDKLDPALLRPGRMDMHIHMSYLTPAGFKLLASTYLNADDQHPLMPEIEDLIQGMKVTPAEVAEELMKSDNVNTALNGLIRSLKSKDKENNVAKKKKKESKENKGEEAKRKGDATHIELVDSRTLLTVEAQVVV